MLSEFSSIDDDAAAKVTVGALSLSVIVIVTACGVLFSSTPVFPETPLIDSCCFIRCSIINTIIGWCKETVPVVAPALITISSRLPEPSV